MSELSGIEVLMNEEWVLSEATDLFMSTQRNDSSECAGVPSQSDGDLTE